MKTKMTITDDTEHDCPTCGTQMQATFTVDKAGNASQVSEPDCEYCEMSDTPKERD